MARVLLLSADLLFGSRVQGDLGAGGHEVELIADSERLGARLRDAGAPRASVLVVDLTDERLEGAGAVESLRSGGLLADLATLGFYSHVDTAARERAEAAGFDRIVPRSRMAREGPALIAAIAPAD